MHKEAEYFVHVVVLLYCTSYFYSLSLRLHQKACYIPRLGRICIFFCNHLLPLDLARNFELRDVILAAGVPMFPVGL